jgi:serine/threonine-protein kinase RsbT
VDADQPIRVESDVDVVQVRQRARDLALALGFSLTQQTVIATAVSEVARNIVSYAGAGEVWLRAEEETGRRGLVAVARDGGPGIADVDKALEDGYSTSGGLGVGLPGARRLMDDLEIESGPGGGTTVTMRKWLR